MPSYILFNVMLETGAFNWKVQLSRSFVDFLEFIGISWNLFNSLTLDLESFLGGHGKCML